MLLATTFYYSVHAKNLYQFGIWIAAGILPLSGRAILSEESAPRKQDLVISLDTR